LSEFRVQNSEIKQTIVSLNGLTGETTYSEGKYVERALLMTKLDALLAYFSLVVDDRKPQIGFGPS